MFKRILSVAALLFCMLHSHAQRSAEFFIVAHQDDWQLFMGLTAYEAINSDTNHKVVFIHTTAGDATFNKPEVNRKFYLAREKGALYSIQFCLDITSSHVRDYIDTVIINGHPILRFANKNVVDYFLRLPDGCGGGGWKGQSIEYLRTRKIHTIMAVDSSTTYNGWGDFVGTLRTIMENEADTCTNIGLNIADTDPSINPGDHPDHNNTALAAIEASRFMDHMWKRYFIGYHSAKMSINLAPEDVALKAAIYGVAEFGRVQNDVWSSWGKDHIEYLCRNYFRIIPSRIDSVLHPGNGQPNVQAAVYPNPVTDILNVSYTMAQAGNILISLKDMNGHDVYPVMNLQKERGDFNTRIDMAALPGGPYLLTFSMPGFQHTFNIIKL